MKVEGGLFIGCAVFFAGTDIVYWYFSHDPAGTAALAFAVGLGFLIGFYMLFTGAVCAASYWGLQTMDTMAREVLKVAYPLVANSQQARSSTLAPVRSSGMA